MCLREIDFSFLGILGEKEILILDDYLGKPNKFSWQDFRSGLSLPTFSAWERMTSQSAGIMPKAGLEIFVPWFLAWCLNHYRGRNQRNSDETEGKKIEYLYHIIIPNINPNLQTVCLTRTTVWKGSCKPTNQKPI